MFRAKQTVGASFGNHHLSRCQHGILGAFHHRITEEVEHVLLSDKRPDAYVLVIDPRRGFNKAHCCPILNLRVPAFQMGTHVIVRPSPAFVGKQADAVSVRHIAVNGELARHHVADEQDEHQTDAQSCHIHQSKEFVSVQKSQICLHRYSVFMELTGFSLAFFQLW